MKDKQLTLSVRAQMRAPRMPALVLVLALLLSASLPGAAALSIGAAPGAVPAFVVAGPGYDGATLDPALTTDGPSLLIARQIYDTLTSYEDGGTLPAPGLASSWTVSSDKLTWTFHLRAGAHFHDGTPVDADAVATNLRRWWDPANPYHQGDFAYFEILFGGFKGDPNCLITAVSASGSDVLITLRTPSSPLLSILAFPAFSIASPVALANGTLATNPVGSGPFRFVERVPGDHVNLAANPDYWGGKASSGVLVFRSIASSEDRVNALRAGDVQVADDAAAPNDQVVRTLGRGATNTGYLGINRAHSPLGDPLVRQAIAHLVNQPAIASVGGGQAADQFLPTGVWGRDPSITDYTYNPALAHSLLTQAGYGSGLTTTLSYRTTARGYMADPKAVAERLKADFALGGITLDLLELPSGDLIAKVNAGEVDLFLLGWSADYPHPHNYFAPHFCAGWKAFLPQDDVLCEIVDQGLQSGSLAEQESLYESASRRVHGTVPVVPLMSGGSSMVVRYNVVGVLPSPVNTESYRLAATAQEGAMTVTASEGGAVGYAAGNTFTSLHIPSGAVTGPTKVTISPTTATAIPTGLVSTGHAFDVQAAPAVAAADGFALGKPGTLTVEYTSSEIAKVQEKTLQLYVWQGEAWTPAPVTCSPASSPVLYTTYKRIVVPVCQLGTFALFGQPLKTLFLPVTRR